jgi:hypothetical protein
MALKDQERGILGLIIEAAKADQLGLIETTNKTTGERVAVLCTVQLPSAGEFLAVPVAKLFDGSPHDELNPPEGTHEINPKNTH